MPCRTNAVSDAGNGTIRFIELVEAGEIALIGDTVDLESLGVHNLHGTTANPTSIFKRIEEESTFYHVWAAVKQTLDERIERRIPNSRLIKASVERFLFELGNSILCRVDGPHFTFVDPRKHNDIGAMVRAARRLVSLFEEKGVQRAKVVVSIPATIEGLRAAQDLEREHGIHTNLYFVSGLLHAAACAEAGATTITIPVGRLLGWYEGRRRTTYEDLSLHPGVETIQSTLEYFKLHELKSKLVGSDFRSISEIPPLLGFDAVSLSTAQIASVRRLQFAPAAVRPSSAVNLRAEQAQFPTSLLSAKASFMEAMSSETRSMVAATLFGPLDELKAYMDGLEAVITYELGRQFELVTVDLKTLYDTSRKGEKAAEEAEEREEPGALRSKRSLAKDLGVEVVPVTQHNDEEVF